MSPGRIPEWMSLKQFAISPVVYFLIVLGISIYLKKKRTKKDMQQKSQADRKKFGSDSGTDRFN